MTESMRSTEQVLPIELETQIEHLAAWAEPQHSDDAEFHHFPHSQEVYQTSMWLADEYEKSGITIDRRKLSFAAITHDIYAHLPISEAIDGQIFESKEERSAFLTFNHLAESGYDVSEVAQPVHDLIISTRNGEPCLEPEAEILRIADIFNTQDFNVFEERAWAIYRETCLFESKNCSFEEWLPGAMGYLKGFIDPSLPEWFKQPANTNIGNLLTKYQAAA